MIALEPRVQQQQLMARAAGAPAGGPPGGNESCIRKTMRAVANFFVAVAQCIWGVITWTCDKLCCICCCCCDSNDDDQIIPETPICPENRLIIEPNPIPAHYRPNPHIPLPQPIRPIEPARPAPIAPVDYPPGHPQYAGPMTDEMRELLAIPDEDSAPDEIDEPVDTPTVPVVPGKEGETELPVELNEHIAEVELTPLDPAEIVVNRLDAMEKLDANAKNKPNYQVHGVRVLDFDLDTALEPYNLKAHLEKELKVDPALRKYPLVLSVEEKRNVPNSTQVKLPALKTQVLNLYATKFVALLDWAAPGFKDRENFRQIVQEQHHNYGFYHPELVQLTKERFRNIFVMLDQRKQELAKTPDAEKEKAFKLLVKNTAIRMNFALNNGNCIVQTNSQTANICTDVLAKVGGTVNLTTNLQLMAGNAIYKHRNNLIKKVVDLRQNPNGQLQQGLFAGGNEVYDELRLRAAVLAQKNNRVAANPFANNGVETFNHFWLDAPLRQDENEKSVPFLGKMLNDAYASKYSVESIAEGLLKWATKHANPNDRTITSIKDSLDAFVKATKAKEEKLTSLRKELETATFLNKMGKQLEIAQKEAEFIYLDTEGVKTNLKAWVERINRTGQIDQMEEAAKEVVKLLPNPLDERPFSFLITALSDPYAANYDVGTLREDLRIWATHTYGLTNEDGEIDENDEEMKALVKRLSGKNEKGEAGDAFSIMADTTYLSREGAIFLLDAAGILEVKK